MVRKVAVALLCLMASVKAGEAVSKCEVPYFRLIPDVTVTGYMYVKAGKSCSIGSENAAGGNTGIDVARRPSNGQVQTRGFNITYKPRPGFVGKDSFAYVRRQLDHRTSAPIRLPVNIEVTVEP